MSTNEKAAAGSDFGAVGNKHRSLLTREERRWIALRKAVSQAEGVYQRADDAVSAAEQKRAERFNALERARAELAKFEQQRGTK